MNKDNIILIGLDVEDYILFFYDAKLKRISVDTGLVGGVTNIKLFYMVINNIFDQEYESIDVARNLLTDMFGCKFVNNKLLEKLFK